jgi:PAS domain S-box-containing protein
MPLSPRSRFILNVTVGYLVFAAAWIVFSDHLLLRLVEPAELAKFSTTKGLIFVGATAALLFAALRATPSETKAPPEPWDGTRIGWQRLMIALAIPLVAFVVQWELWLDISPYAWLLFFPAVFLSSSVGGLPGGLLATLLSTLLVWYGFTPPRFSFSIENPHAIISIGVFFAMGVLLALTHGRLRQAERLAAEAKFRALVDQSLAGIYILQDSRFRYANLAFARMFGYASPEEMIERLPVEAVVAAQDRPMVIEKIRQRIDGEISELRYGFRGRRADDSLFDVDIHGRSFRYEGRPAVIGVALDVTELEQYRTNLEHLIGIRTAEVQAANDKLQDTQFAMDCVGIAIHWVDVDTGRFLYVNSFAAEMLGYSVDEMLSLSVPDINPNFPAGGFKEASESFRQQRRVEFQAMLIAKDGRIIPCEGILHFLPGKDAMPGRFITFVTDITKRKAAETAREAALNEAERLATLRRDFLANMSHEIRTPLNAVLGLAQIGARDNTGRKCQGVFNRILTAGHGLLEVVDDILDFSKIESGKMGVESVPLVIGEVIDRTVHLVALRANAKGLHFAIEEEPGLPVGCLGDSKRLQQVLVNLLSNAVKFTPQGGAVVLSASCDAEHLLFRISDTGIGIAPDTIERLFQPFEQTDSSTTRHFGGTGLGLPISRHLVEMMGGEITVQSVLGQGSNFDVRLPLAGVIPPGPKPKLPLALYGLPLDEVESIRRAVGACVSLSTLDHVPDGTAMIVIDAAVLAEDRIRAQGEAHLAQGLRVAVVVTDGSLDMRSTLWNGATIIERPLRARHVLAALSPTEPKNPAAGSLPRLSGLSILSAEDNELNRLILEDILRCEGAEVTCVENGQFALERLRQQGAHAFDVVLTDIQMPGMDGYALARAITAMAPRLPVIGLTAHAMQEERTRCLAAGMVEHVPKPIDLDILVAAILRHTRERNETSPLALAHLIVDWRQLEIRYSGRHDFIKRLLELVVSAHAETPRDLRDAVGAGNMAQVAKLVHSLKGTAGNLAAHDLQSLATQTERAVRDSTAEARELVEHLADAVEAMLSAIASRESVDGN